MKRVAMVIVLWLIVAVASAENVTVSCTSGLSAVPGVTVKVIWRTNGAKRYATAVSGQQGAAIISGVTLPASVLIEQSAPGWVPASWAPVTIQTTNQLPAQFWFTR
jgi:hypothetical protein